VNRPGVQLQRYRAGARARHDAPVRHGRARGLAFPAPAGVGRGFSRIHSRVADRRGFSRIFCFIHGSRIGADPRGSFASFTGRGSARILADLLLHSQVADRRALSRIFCFTHESRIHADSADPLLHSRGADIRGFPRILIRQQASVPDPRISSTRARASRGAWTGRSPNHKPDRGCSLACDWAIARFRRRRPKGRRARVLHHPR
jgi:hypothetical protein